MEKITVDYKVIRHLRNVVAHMCNYGTAQLRIRAMEALKTHTDLIKLDCPHIDLIKINDQQRQCLDCGMKL